MIQPKFVSIGREITVRSFLWRVATAFVLIAILARSGLAQPIPIAAVSRTDSVSFEKEIVPILRQSCLACHSANDASGELVLETPQSILRGGDSGPAIVAGKSGESLLLKLAAHQEDPVMPPEGNDVEAKTLTSQQLGLIKLWIDQGAKGSGLSATLSPERWRPLPQGQHPIGTVAISPDGQFVACGRANQIFIYHVATGQLVTRLTDPSLQEMGADSRPGIAHLDVVQSLRFSQQGDVLASGGFRTAKLWRYPRNVQLRALETDAEIRTVAVSPDRSLAASGGVDGKIRLWSLVSSEETPAPPLVLEGHVGEVRGLCFSTDGQKLISTSIDKSIRVWNVLDGKLTGRIDTSAELHGVASMLLTPGPPSGANAANAANATNATNAKSAAGVAPELVERIVTGGGDNLLRFWNIPRQLPQAMPDVPPKTTVLSGSKDGKLLALGTSDGSVRIVDSQTSATIHQWAAHSGPILDIAFGQVPETTAQPMPAGTVVATKERRLAVSGADGIVRVWSLGSLALEPAGTADSTADSTTDSTAAAVAAEAAIPAAAIPAAAVAVGKEPEPPVELVALHGSLLPVRSVDFRADGQQLVAGAEDGAVTVWNLDLTSDQASSRVAVNPPESADPPEVNRRHLVAVSPDSKLMASTSSINGHAAILIRDVVTGKLVHTFLGHSGPIVSLEFSRDNSKVVSGSADMTARVWDLGSSKFPEVARFSEHTGPVTAVAFNSDGQQVLSGSADNSVKLWKVADGELAMDFPGHTAAIVAVAMTANNQPISASVDKTVRVWNPANGQVARSQTEVAPVTAMSLSRDSARIAVAAADKNIRVYATTGGAAQLTMTGHALSPHSIAFNFDNTRIVSGDGQAAIVWDTSDGRLLEISPLETQVDQAKPAETKLASVAYARVPTEAAGQPAGQTTDQIVLADNGENVTRRALKFLGAARGMKMPITAVVFHPAGQSIIVGCQDGTVRGFNVANVANFAQAYSANHGAPVNDIAINHDGSRLASAGENKIVRLWNPANGAVLQPTQLTGLTGPARCVDFSADGERVLAGSNNGTSGELIVFHLTAPAGVIEQSIVGHATPVAACLAIESDGRAISLSNDGVVLSWELLATHRIAGHTQPVTSVSTIPFQEGQPPQILSGSLDGTVRRWNALTGQLLGQMNHGGPVTSVAVRADGQRFASCSSNNTIRLWGTANNQIAQMAGDLGSKTLVAKLTQQKNDATAKVTAAKALLVAAEAALPVKTTAETAAATALATADKDVSAKATLLTTASTKKATAEKLAIEAAAVAQTAAAKMSAADLLAKQMTARAADLTAKAVRPRAAASVAPNNAALAKLAETAVANAAKADTEAKAAVAAKAAPTAEATKTAAAAAAAATAAIALNKPFTDADTALALSQATQRSAKQAHDVATRDLKIATEAVPASKKSVETVEALLKRLDGELVAAVAAEQAAQQPVQTVAFSPDNRTLVTGGDFGVVHSWNAETGAAISSYAGHSAAINLVTFIDNDTAISSSADKNAVIWNLNPSWRLERVIGDIRDPSILIDRVASVDISSDGKLLATGGGVPSRSGEVKVWNIADGALVREMVEAHTDAVAAVAFSPDDQFVASAGADKYVKKFDTASGEQVAQFEGHTNYALGVSWRGGGKILASCGADGTIRIWNADTGDGIRTIQGFTKQISAVRFIGETQFAVVATGQAIVRKYNTDNGGVQTNYGGPQEFMFAIDATGDPNNGIVVAGGYDGQLRIWRANGPVLQTIGPPEEPTADLPVAGN